jgi:hypothetical protein
MVFLSTYSLILSLGQRSRCSSSMVEFGIWHIVHSLDSYMPFFLKWAARRSCHVLSLKFATASFLGLGVWGSVMVKALRCWSDGPRIDSRWCHWILSDIFPSDCTMALGSTQPLVKMSTRNIPGGKGGRCLRLTTSQPSRAECHEIWEPKPPGTLWATPGL